MILITGSTGLIGSVASEYFLLKGKKIFGVDNNLRKYFFGINGSNKWKEKKLKGYKNYYHSNVDLRNEKKVYDIFKKHGKKIKAIIHTAAQPSHDWAAKEPLTDFQVNANATLNLLEATRKYCPEVPFIFTSTNKVYGDTPNFLPFVEKKFSISVFKSSIILTSCVSTVLCSLSIRLLNISSFVLFVTNTFTKHSLKCDKSIFT